MDPTDPVEATRDPAGASHHPVDSHLEQAVVEANLALREELEERTRALDGAESRFRAILGATQDGVVVVDRDGSVVFANSAAARLLQREQRELMGEPFGLPVGAEEPVLIELIGKDRSLRTVQMQVVETEWEGTTAHLATLHDVTEMKGAEEVLRQVVRRLEEVNDLKNEFVGMVVHDMRTPLTVISGFAQTLRQNWERIDDRHKKNLLQRIESKSAELARMVSDTLQVSTIESNSFKYDFAEFDLGSLIYSTVELITEATRRDIHIGYAIHEPLPPVFADPQRQTQVLTNLISNAIKYSDPPIEITISVQRSDTDLQVSIADRGRGIAAAEMSKLFKKFSRLRQDLDVQGSGLGLYICKRMIEEQGGRIWAESEPGVGSTFHYTIPIAIDGRDRTSGSDYEERG